MTSKHQTATTFVVLLLVYALALLPVHANSTSPGAAATRQIGSQVPSAARLVTRNDQPILVNGNKLTTGGTVLAGATLETPRGVGATVSLASLWTLDLAPETKLTLNFADTTVSVMLNDGRALLDAKKGITATFKAGAGQAVVNEPGGDSFLDISFPPGASTPTVSRQAVAGTDAGAASVASSCPPANDPRDSRFSWYYLIPILGGSLVPIVVLTHRGENPSPMDSLGP